MSDSARRYKVTGIHPVLGHKPGTEFTATIPAAQEAALIAGRGLVRVAKPPVVTVPREEDQS